MYTNGSIPPKSKCVLHKFFWEIVKLCKVIITSVLQLVYSVWRYFRLKSLIERRRNKIISQNSIIRAFYLCWTCFIYTLYIPNKSLDPKGGIMFFVGKLRKPERECLSDWLDESENCVRRISVDFIIMVSVRARSEFFMNSKLPSCHRDPVIKISSICWHLTAWNCNVKRRKFDILL